MIGLQKERAGTTLSSTQVRFNILHIHMSSSPLRRKRHGVAQLGSPWLAFGIRKVSIPNFEISHVGAPGLREQREQAVTRTWCSDVTPGTLLYSEVILGDVKKYFRADLVHAHLTVPDQQIESICATNYCKWANS